MKLQFKLITVIAIIACACTSNKTSNSDGAQELYDQIEKAVDQGEFESAIALIDSLNNAFPDNIDLRRKAMPLRAKAYEGIALHNIPDIERQLADAMLNIDNFGPLMDRIGEGPDYYMVPKGWPRATTSNGIEPRVDSNGNFRLVLKHNGKLIGLNSVSFESGQQSCSTPPVDPSRVATLSHNEMLSLTQEECASAIDWLREHKSAQSVLMTLNGSNGSDQAKLDGPLIESLLKAWDFAMAQQHMAQLINERNRMERQLQLSRDQQAQLTE